MTKDTWEMMVDWRLVLPPSRPSASQLVRWGERLRELERNVPVAILGSTPELRDLLCELGFKDVVLFERNLKFLKAMTALRVTDSVEKVVEGDWLQTLTQAKNTFGAVLSDLTSGNIPYHGRREFYRAVEGMLARGGVFLDKVLTHGDELRPVTRLLDRYASLPVNLLYVNYFSCEVLFCSDLLKVNETVDSSAFYAELDRICVSPRLRAFATQARLITPEQCVWWYGRSWTRLEPNYCPALIRERVDEDESTSPYAGNLKFFTLRKP